MKDVIEKKDSGLYQQPAFTDPKTTHFAILRSRGELPHLFKPGATYFVTFRLADAIESHQTTVSNLVNYKLEHVAQAGECRLKLGACSLANPKVARMMARTLMHFHTQRYHLHSWCVMPNHVHVVVTPLAENTLSSILHSWKSYSANQANDLTKSKEPFWQRESFNHICRTVESVNYFVKYVEENPVQAGLCERSEDWPYSSAGWKPAPQ
jgi:REP element-mobilizing transposase RayT